MRRPWTREEIEFLREYYGKIPAREIAEKLGRTPGAVRAKARVLGLSELRARPWTREEIETLKRLYGEVRQRELGKILHRSEHAVRTKLYELGLTYTTKDKVRELRKYLRESLEPTEAAYLAGSVDGGGTITLMLKRRRRKSYRE